MLLRKPIKKIVIISNLPVFARQMMQYYKFVVFSFVIVYIAPLSIIAIGETTLFYLNVIENQVHGCLKLPFCTTGKYLLILENKKSSEWVGRRLSVDNFRHPMRGFSATERNSDFTIAFDALFFVFSKMIIWYELRRKIRIIKSQNEGKW